MAHTGIYLGDGTVVDARGTKDGVLHQPIEKYGKWTHWGIPNGLYDGQAETPDEEMEAAGMTATVVGGKLKLRNAASTSAGVLLGIPEGSTVAVLEKGSEWCKVQYESAAGTRTGYVMSQY